MGEQPKGLPAGGNSAMLVSNSDDPAVVDAAWKFLKFATSGKGAAVVAETTGYMPPNKAANEMLGEFYEALESIVTGDADDMQDLQEELVEEVNSLMPK